MVIITGTITSEGSNAPHYVCSKGRTIQSAVKNIEKKYDELNFKVDCIEQDITEILQNKMKSEWKEKYSHFHIPQGNTAGVWQIKRSMYDSIVSAIKAK